MNAGICNNMVNLESNAVQADMSAAQVSCRSFSTDGGRYDYENCLDVMDDDILEVRDFCLLITL